MNAPPTPGATPIVVAIGASAGGVEALSAFIGALPQSFVAPVLVVLHIGPGRTSVLPDILDRLSHLRIRHAIDGEVVETGRGYVAPPDQHLSVADGRIRLHSEPHDSLHRPAVDPTFRALAEAYGPRAVGVVLSGTLDDGSRGLAAIKTAGGMAFVQDPAECRYDGMPRSAIRATEVDGVLPTAAIAARIAELARPDGAVIATCATVPPDGD